MFNTKAESYQNSPGGHLKYSVGTAFKKEYEDAMDLAWVTFTEFVAPDYTQEGIDSFREFICDPILFKMFERGEYQVFLARSNADIIGLGSLRNKNQISLLFVDKKWHNMGVGRALIEHLSVEVKNNGLSGVKVNSSPYALHFYHKLGFKDINKKMTIDGIIFTPMEKFI